jgi:hypothetical protein
MFNDPVIFCVPIKEFEPVLANELVCELVTKLEVCEFNVYGDNIEPVCAFNTKLLVCEFFTNEPVSIVVPPLPNPLAAADADMNVGSI